MKTVTVVSAVELSSKQKESLVDGLCKKHGKVVLQEVIDPTVLGGVKVTIGSSQANATIAAKLDTLKKSL